MIKNKNATSLALFLVVVFNMVGIVKFTEDPILWIIVDSYNIIILTIFANEFFRERIVVLHAQAMGLLSGICVLGIFAGYAIGTDKYWSFIDIFVAIVASLMIVKVLMAKTKN